MGLERICEIHNTPLQHMQVPVGYGSPIPDPALWEARKRLFPHSKLFALGGCTTGLIGDYVEELVCSKCREIEVEWRKDNHRELKFRGMEI